MANGTGIILLYGKFLEGNSGMCFFRKIIYIGESEGKAVYFDTKLNHPVMATKSLLLSTENSRNNGKIIILALFILFSLTGVTQLFPNMQFLIGHYSFRTIIYFIIIWLLECFVLVALVERALYKNVNAVKLADRNNFKNAIDGNLIWNSFNNKKVTANKKIFAWCFTIFIVLIGFLAPVLILTITLFNMFGKPIGSEIITLSLAGVVTGVSVILIWQNNLIRWFQVVEKYQARKIKWRMKDE